MYLLKTAEMQFIYDVKEEDIMQDKIDLFISLNIPYELFELIKINR